MHEIFPSDEGMFLWLAIAGILAWGAGAGATTLLLWIQRGQPRQRFYIAVGILGLLFSGWAYLVFEHAAAVVLVLFPYAGLLATVVYALELQSPPRSVLRNAIIGGFVVAAAAVVGIMAALTMAFGS